MSTRRVVATGVVLIALAAGGIVAVDWFRNRLPGDPWELDKACSGKTYAKGAAYQGTAPHPVAIFMTSPAGFLEHTTLYPPKGAAWRPSDPDETSDVQLVVCATLAAEVPTGETCGYGPGGIVASTAVPMSQATYQVRVLEVRTGRELRSVSVQGEDAECPSAIATNPSPERLLSEPTFAQWQQVLGDLVSRNR